MKNFKSFVALTVVVVALSSHNSNYHIDQVSVDTSSAKRQLISSNLMNTVVRTKGYFIIHRL